MQKKIIALAIAAAFAAPVSAMADTTVYGTMDLGVRMKTVTAAKGVAQADNNGTGMDLNGIFASNAWGIKSVEDIGDGMKATVNFEADFVPDAGNFLFDRAMTAGLSGDFGAVTGGWQYTSAFKSSKKYDPLGYAFVKQDYAAQSNLGSRGMIIDYTNKFGDVGVNAQYKMDDEGVDHTSKITDATIGSGYALAVDYAAGPVSVGGSYSEDKSGVNATGNATTGARNISVGAGFNFGDGDVKVGYARKAQDVGTTANSGTETTSNMWVGATYNVSSKIGTGLVYYKSTFASAMPNGIEKGKSRIVAMATYALSKKVTGYVAYGTETVDNYTNATQSALTANTENTTDINFGVAFKF